MKFLQKGYYGVGIHGTWPPKKGGNITSETPRRPSQPYVTRSIVKQINGKFTSTSMEESWPTAFVKEGNEAAESSNRDIIFWDKEFVKHGIHTGLGAFDYFSRTLTLFNGLKANLKYVLHRSNDIPTSSTEFREFLTNFFGYEVHLTCKEFDEIHYLDELQFSTNWDITEIVDSPVEHSNCPEYFVLPAHDWSPEGKWYQTQLLSWL